MSRLPTLFIPLGGGPRFFMNWDPPDTWHRMAEYLRRVPSDVGARPRALVDRAGTVRIVLDGDDLLLPVARNHRFDAMLPSGAGQLFHPLPNERIDALFATYRADHCW